jgi:hypothetical protein
MLPGVISQKIERVLQTLFAFICQTFRKKLMCDSKKFFVLVIDLFYADQIIVRPIG